ncbi:hypothetical protein GCM10025866_13900 [Naasia aerilata]|uniref:Uncharacterized protein n=1 Tax=Naasia aerilata TaxID=1162966 RepID=A0ABM8GB74_9MICO|nr:hypothetical protein GCM10025866_13900 [Naasia aerilata]
MGITLSPMLRRDLEFNRAHGLEPAWSRVWRGGQDVTDRPELWPWPWAGKPSRQQIEPTPGS